MPNYERIGTFKPWRDANVRRMERSDSDIAALLIKKIYRNTIEHHKKRINATLFHFYGKNLNFPERMTTQIKERIFELMEVTDKEITEIVQTFKSYFGEDCSFYRKEGAKLIPVDSERLLKAYNAIQDGRLKTEVSNILYNA